MLSIWIIIEGWVGKSLTVSPDSPWPIQYALISRNTYQKILFTSIEVFSPSLHLPPQQPLLLRSLLLPLHGCRHRTQPGRARPRRPLSPHYVVVVVVIAVDFVAFDFMVVVLVDRRGGLLGWEIGRVGIGYGGVASEINLRLHWGIKKEEWRETRNGSL